MKQRAPRNRTISLTAADRKRLLKKLVRLESLPGPPIPLNSTICGDYRELVPVLPKASVDLMILDPPYNLDKNFNGSRFSRRSVDDYTNYLYEMLTVLKPLLKKTATIYICGDWFSSASIFAAASKFFIVRNRITWEREKGRGASKNWKNSSEDIWFCTVSKEFTFNVSDVKLRRKVIAPYRHDDGTPKDWKETKTGNYRDTAPSNLWTDITIPFWSMPENTDHPTQKSEKLIAKLVHAGSNPGDLVFDPFLGSGTTSVVAKKLNRKYLGVEIEEEYCLLAERRLELADDDISIQGLTGGVFWERNTLPDQASLDTKKGMRRRK
ncbi:MAG: site-specific DNA-methyltransferase [candidate division Zixibacteria bacterium HGW-Zixibacteria-1]|nr:MAG: site-specific DNA-methyltransferase [candidate division Zixibacteria bacterium HGW-Zixibacteria-1]